MQWEGLGVTASVVQLLGPGLARDWTRVAGRQESRSLGPNFGQVPLGGRGWELILELSHVSPEIRKSP